MKSQTRRNISPTAKIVPATRNVERVARSNSKTGSRNSSMVRKYNQLEAGAKQAINETFLLNVKARKNRVSVG